MHAIRSLPGILSASRRGDSRPSEDTSTRSPAHTDTQAQLHLASCSLYLLPPCFTSDCAVSPSLSFSLPQPITWILRPCLSWTKDASQESRNHQWSPAPRV
jgi:hypothetical protein